MMICGEQYKPVSMLDYLSHCLLKRVFLMARSSSLAPFCGPEGKAQGGSSVTVKRVQNARKRISTLKTVKKTNFKKFCEIEFIGVILWAQRQSQGPCDTAKRIQNARK